VSRKGSPSLLAKRRPTVDLPAPMRPTRTIGRSRRSVRFPTSRAIQRAASAAKAVSFQSNRRECHASSSSFPYSHPPGHCRPDVLLLQPRWGGSHSFDRDTGERARQCELAACLRLRPQLPLRFQRWRRMRRLQPMRLSQHPRRRPLQRLRRLRSRQHVLRTRWEKARLAWSS